MNVLKIGSRVKVDFISESRTIYSGKRFTGVGVIDRLEDGRVLGRLDDGQPFMCLPWDVEVIEDKGAITNLNAHKFVSIHGIKAVKHAIEEANAYGGDWIDTKTLEIKKHIPSGESVFIGELKQVVESIGIVQRSGGFDSVKAAITNYRASGDMVTFSSLEKRLADYELVESYKQAKIEVLDMVDVSPHCEVRNG